MTEQIQDQDRYFMSKALKLAEYAQRMGEVPIGAVLVKDGEVVAEGYNRREMEHDPAGHAEFLAIHIYSRLTREWRMTGCTLYVTLEPCIMCAGLLQQARVDRCVFGAYDPKGGALGSLYQINADERLNHTYEVTGGVMEEECGQILKDFFARKREQNKQE